MKAFRIARDARWGPVVNPACYAIAVLVVLAVPAFATDADITQKNKTFSQTTLTFHVGDTLRIHNEDNVTHNITVRSLDGATSSDDLGLQKPGQMVAHHFVKAGQYRVVCSIHPHMRINVTVQ